MLGAGADAEIKNIDGETPLMWTCRRGDVGCVKALLSHGVDTAAKDMLQGMTALEMLKQGADSGRIGSEELILLRESV